MATSVQDRIHRLPDQTITLDSLYCDAPHNTQQPFDNAISDDDPLALAISETLTPEEIAHAFAWAEASFRSPDKELAAIPVFPCLGAEQQLRVRAMLVATDAADEAWMAAVGSRQAPRRDLNRALEMGTRRFVEAMTSDAVSGCAKARINGEQQIPHPAICGAGDDSERWVGI